MVRLLQLSFLPLFIFLFAFKPAGKVSYVTMDVNSRVLNKGKYISSSGKLSYNAVTGTLGLHMLQPENLWIFTDVKGEMSIYYPSANKVTVKQGLFLAKAGYMYHFLTGQLNDLGLKDMGMQVVDTKFKDGRMITSWMPAAVKTGLIGKVELVHEDYKPIYTAWYNSGGECMLKSYFSNYQSAGGLNFPLNVTEIKYLSSTDSTIEKRTYSAIHINENADKEVYSFKIPENAIRVEE